MIFEDIKSRVSTKATTSACSTELTSTFFANPSLILPKESLQMQATTAREEVLLCWELENPPVVPMGCGGVRCWIRSANSSPLGSIRARGRNGFFLCIAATQVGHIPHPFSRSAKPYMVGVVGAIVILLLCWRSRSIRSEIVCWCCRVGRIYIDGDAGQGKVATISHYSSAI